MQPLPRLNDPRLEAGLEADGYAVVPDFLGAREIEQLLLAFAEHDSPVHRQGFGASILSNDLEYRSSIDVAIKDAFRSRIDAVFNGYRHCFSNFVVKAPQPASAGGMAGEIPLHQDIAMVDESRYQTLGVWCPLVDTTLVNGCLFVAPGSHRLNTGPRGPGTPFPYGALSAHFKLRAVPMKAGSAMVFCQKLIHSSPPNRGAAIRVVAAGLFAPRDAKLFCYYPKRGSSKMEVFEVDDLFYTRYIYGTRPEAVRRVAEIDYWHAPLTAEQLRG